MTVRENCFHVVVGVILFNLICNMIIFLKENCSDLLTHPEVKGVLMCEVFACMLLSYISFPLI